MGLQGRGHRGPLDLGAQRIAVKHNMEMAHRLTQTKGKCEQIHGHSWWVTLTIGGTVSEAGIVWEFGELKGLFRGYLDTMFDHKLVLNESDPIVETLTSVLASTNLKLLPYDPTTENIAYYIHEWAEVSLPIEFASSVEVWETSVNYARYP